MSVNREGRDRFANALADYMRGRITNLDLNKVIDELPSDDRSLNRLIWNVWFLYDDFRAHPLIVTEVGWNLLRRILAFVRTDLEFPIRQRRWRWLHWKQPLAILALAALIAAYAWATSPWILPALWLAIGFAGYLTMSRPTRPRSTQPDWFPFETEADWHRYEHLAAAFDLPEYDPDRCNPAMPIRSPLLDRIRCIPGTLLLIAAAPLFLILGVHSANRICNPAGGIVRLLT